jgi:hypothetical protein
VQFSLMMAAAWLTCEEGQVGTTSDVEEDTAGSIDGDIKKLVGDRLSAALTARSSPLARPTAIKAAPPSSSRF